MSPDRRLLATSSRDRAVGVFDVQFSVPVRRRVLVEPFGVQSRHTETGPDKQGRIYRVSKNGIHVFDDAFAERPSFRLDDRKFLEVQWSADRLFATSDNGELLQWATIGEPRLVDTVRVGEHFISACEILAAEQLLLDMQPFGVGVWSLPERRFTRTWPEHHNIAAAPDGRTFVLARNRDYGLVLYDAKTLGELGTLTGHTYGVADVKFSQDGKRLYSCSSDRSIRVWDVEAKREILQLRGHEDPIECLAVMPDEQTLASADETGGVRLWDLRTGREFFDLFQHNQAFRRLDFTADGEDLVGIDTDFDRLIEFRWSCRAAASSHP